jgi:dihydroxy-acid dehydratase
LPNEKPDWARRGYARLFHDSVLQADEGCDCDFDFMVDRDQI